MCGIAGIIYKNGNGAHRIGRDLTSMLQSMKHRGPDSTGYALYHAPTHELTVRIKLADSTAPRDLEFADDVRRRRRETEARLKAAGATVKSTEEVNEYTYSATLDYHGDLKQLADYVESVPQAEVLSLGHSLEIIKDLGDARGVSAAYQLDEYFGSHGIGHVRMATESDVDIANAHPYWAYPFSDVAVVHNGQLTNYHQWRRRLESRGHRFASMCDSEIIAVYLADRMADGDGLEDAMNHSLEDLDGVFTYMCVSEDSLGVAKDELAAKPLVLYEGDDMVALASEEMAIRAVIDHEIETYDPYESDGDGMDAVTAGQQQEEPLFDARGLVELNARVPRVSEIDGDKATFDARNLTTRQINLELRWLLYEQGVNEVTVLNPGAKHSLGAGLLTRCRVNFEGSLGYFALGMIDGPEVHIAGRVGWSACENMMSGVVVIESNAGSLTGAAIRGGDLVVKGQVGARSGIDQKGGTIITLGDAGSMTGFMMQRGRQILCGNVGPGLGDSMYDGVLYVGGKVKSLGIDCVEGEWTDADTELIERKFRIYELGSPPEFQKFVCGKKLYNYDSLEPSERKLVL